MHLRRFLCGSVLLAASVARTSNWCEPPARLMYVFGLEQAVNSPPSILHSIDDVSLALNVNNVKVRGPPVSCASWSNSAWALVGS